MQIKSNTLIVLNNTSSSLQDDTRHCYHGNCNVNSPIFRTTLDIVTIGLVQHQTDDDSVGVYYTIEGYRDGVVARILKGKKFSLSK